MPFKSLNGQSILVVEDNGLIAMNLEDILRDAGASVVGPVGTLRDAERVAAESTITGAVLDIMLEDQEVWPVAQILSRRGIPFIFSSGHFEQDTLPKEWANRRIVSKPARAQEIVRTLRTAIEGAARGDV